MKNILVIYNLIEYPVAVSLIESIYAFRKYSQDKIFYLNFFYSPFPWYLNHVKFDIILFHHSLTNFWHEHRFHKILNKLKAVNFGEAKKAVFFQDEYHHTDWRCEFINELSIDNVFSVAPETEWVNIYNKVDFKKVRFHRILTGYLDENTIKEVALLEYKSIRKIDIFFRTLWINTYRIGRFGMYKYYLVKIFKEKTRNSGLIVDLEIGNNSILGTKWYKYLLSSKYTIGCESGASLLDRDGSLTNKINKYLFRHPVASFEETETNCFPSLDGNLNLKAIGPRHLEACMTKTCQILIEGEYNGILKPNIHYIKLKSDFSNIDEVIDIIKEDKKRQKIIENAYNDIVLSGNYTYKKFVEFVFSKIETNSINNETKFAEKFWYSYSVKSDILNRYKAFIFKLFLTPVYNYLIKKVSLEKVNGFLKTIKL